MESFYRFSVRFQHGPSLTGKVVLGTPAVLIGVVLIIILRLTFSYAPVLQRLFDTRPIGFRDGAAAIGVGLALS